jgi:MFS family permease
MAAESSGELTRDDKLVVLASSFGTIFEWYDFYLYGSLVPILGTQFFSAYPPAGRDIFALLTFAAGFLVRPPGAVAFGRIGDPASGTRSCSHPSPRWSASCFLPETKDVDITSN